MDLSEEDKKLLCEHHTLECVHEGINLCLCCKLDCADLLCSCCIKDHKHTSNLRWLKEDRVALYKFSNWLEKTINKVYKGVE